MKITWLGQAGLLFETEGMHILVDPYLSDSVKEIQPHFWRRVPVDERFLEITPDVILLTHDHLDHTDPETLAHYLGEDTAVTVLASENAWNRVRVQFGGIRNNYVRLNAGAEWSERGVRFSAVRAHHSDAHAVGFLLFAEGKTYYITGDTLYDESIFAALPEHIDAVFLPVNGVGNNMNMQDGARFAARVGGVAVPLHCGLFDEIDMHTFPYENKVVPEFYKEIELK